MLRVTKIDNSCEPFAGSDPACENQRDVVRLLRGANPVLDGGDGVFGDPGQRQVAIGGYSLNQALFAELSKFIFRLGDAVTERDENISWIQLHSFFFVVAVWEESHDGAAFFQPPDRAVARKDDRRKVAGVGIGEPLIYVVIKAKEKCGVFFRLGALKKVTVQEPQHLCGRGRRHLCLKSGDPGVGSVSCRSAHRKQLFLLISANRGVYGGHQQRRGKTLAADVAHGNSYLVRTIGEKIIVVTADDARRPADPVKFQRAGAGYRLRK